MPKIILQDIVRFPSAQSAMQSAWNIYLGKHPGSDWSAEPSRMVEVYSALVLGRKALLANDYSTRAHLFARCINAIGKSMDADLRAALDDRLDDVDPIITDFDDFTAPMREAQRYLGFNTESLPKAA